MAKKKKRRLKKWVKIALAVILLILIIICGVFIMTRKDKSDQPNDTTTQTSQPQGMESLYYYDASRKDRYEAYKQAHPDYSDEMVVWQVNVDMDKDDYTDMVMIDEADENNIVLLVNKHFRLRDDYEPENLVLYNDYYYMTQETKVAFTQMVNAASEEGIYLNPGSTYRSVAYQRDLYSSYASEDGVEEADTYSARAGSSEHHTGRAIDLVGPDWTLDSFGGTDASDWIIEHAYEYGFIVRYQEETEYITGYIYEPWHITYVGKDCATIMHDNNITTLEEYYVKYVMYSPN